MFRHLLATALLFSSLTAVLKAADSPPNIVIIFTDDHGYADLSCQGIVDDIRTPHIDHLAREGVRMTSGYVTAPQCVPSRAGLLSGRFQNRLGVESNGMPLDQFNEEQTIAERLKNAGYATGMIGKWHLGPADEIVQHGFDDVFYQGGSWTNFDVQGNDVTPGTKVNGMYHLDANSAAARAFIQRHHDQPFLLYLAYRAPHVPLDATPEYLKRFTGPMPERRRQALAMLSAVDDGVGGVLQTLRDNGIEERTLVFFIGDNGAPLKIHKLDSPGGGPGWDGSLNNPLNGEKGMLSEGGIRVPFVVYWKNRIPGGQVYHHPVISLDVAATAVALAGLPVDTNLDGVNLIPHLLGTTEAAPHQELYWRWIAQSAIRQGKWKYLRGGSREYLFDLEADREEKTNLITEHPEFADLLSRKLEKWSSELHPPGLETNSMSEVWERYFDFYLDGKSAPAPSIHSGKTDSDRRFQGWVGRNCKIDLVDGMLQVRPSNQNGTAFIATAQLRAPANSIAVLRLRARSTGSARITWREKGQAGFVENQSVAFACKSSDGPVEYKVAIPASNEVIHLRLILPRGGADIESIRINTPEGESIKSWRFGS